ncbi:SufS family cysteine desulfurase [Paraglaciecola aestuariivivens]
MSLDILRQHFPIFSAPEKQSWVYLDSAATSQKLQSVIDITQAYYQEQAVNVHRSSHQLASAVTAEFEQARHKVQKFIGAKQAEEIVWTKGATEAINLVANGLGQSYFTAGDEILISALEHHANIVPWQQVAKKLNLQLKVIPVDAKGVIQLEQALKLINANTALVAIGHVSNALGNINPIAPIIKKAQQFNALTLIDGTQAVNHLQVDVQKIDCDFYVFSGHKMFGPTGIGVLYGKYHLLEQLPPYQTGGEMIVKVSFSESSFQPPPLKFEAGTPNIAGVLGMKAAIDFIQQHRQAMQKIEHSLYQALLSGLNDIPEITLWGDTQHSISLQSFTVNNISHYDLAVLLDKHNIAIRVGHHCAMPLMETLGIDGTLRVSIGPYNTLEEIQTFVQVLANSLAKLKAPLDESIGKQENQPKQEVSHSLPPLAQKIKQAKGWDQTYRQLMLAGKDLTPLADHLKTAESEVSGCESPVWVHCVIRNNQLQVSGDSPSKIVRGLLAVICEVLSQQTPQQALDFDLTAYLTKLDLHKHLSPSRGNGLAAMVLKIRQYCQRHCDGA